MVKHKSIIVVGAGITGLTTATSLAMRGHSVLLLEKNDTYGGFI